MSDPLKDLSFRERQALAQEYTNSQAVYQNAGLITGLVPAVVGAGLLAAHIKRMRDQAKQQKELEALKQAAAGDVFVDTLRDIGGFFGNAVDSLGNPAAGSQRAPAQLWTTAVGIPLAAVGGAALYQMIRKATPLKSKERMEKERLAAQYRALLEAERGLKQASELSPELRAVDAYIREEEKRANMSLYNLAIPIGVSGGILSGVLAYQAAKKNDIWRDRAAVREAITSRRDGRLPEYLVALDSPELAAMDSAQREVIPVSSQTDPERTRKLVRRVLAGKVIDDLEPMAKAAGLDVDDAIDLLPALGAVVIEQALERQLFKQADYQQPVDPAIQQRMQREFLASAPAHQRLAILKQLRESEQGKQIAPHLGSDDTVAWNNLMGALEGKGLKGVTSTGTGPIDKAIGFGTRVLGMPTPEALLQERLSSGIQQEMDKFLTPNARAAYDRAMRDYAMNPSTYAKPDAFKPVWSNVENAAFRDKLTSGPIGSFVGGMNNAQWAGVLGSLPLLFGKNKGWGAALLAASMFGPQLFRYLPAEMQQNAQQLWNTHGGALKNSPLDFFKPMNARLANEVGTPPANNQNQAPANNQNQAPANNQNQAPANNQNQAPANNQNQAPANNQNQAPANNQNQAPANNQNQAPANNQNQAPAASGQTKPTQPPPAGNQAAAAHQRGVGSVPTSKQPANTTRPGTVPGGGTVNTAAAKPGVLPG
jgi:hypothetical protein